MVCVEGATNVEAGEQPVDCWDIFHRSGGGSDTYEVFPLGIRPVRVDCDMSTDGGGWTVRRYVCNRKPKLYGLVYVKAQSCNAFCSEWRLYIWNALQTAPSPQFLAERYY